MGREEVLRSMGGGRKKVLRKNGRREGIVKKVDNRGATTHKKSLSEQATGKLQQH